MFNKQIASGAKRVLLGFIPFGIVILFATVIAIPSTSANPNAAPILTDHGPAANSPAVAVSADITATFSADPDPASVTHTTFAVHSPFYGLVTGTLSANTNQISLAPTSDFKAGDQVQVIATAGITNTDGPLNPAHQWGFTTGRVADRCFDTFVDSGETLTGVAQGGGRWIDVDGDSDLDVVVSGQTGAGLATQILLNDGSGAFVDSGTADDALIAVQNGSVTVGDYNNDSDPDILLTGLASGFVPTIQLGRNNSGSFVDSGPDDANLWMVHDGMSAWADYDNDGDLDLLISGMSQAGAVTKIFRNDAGTFVDSGVGTLPLQIKSAAAWGDYDGDGYPDLFISGLTDSSGPTSKILKNNGGTSFSDSGATPTAVHSGSAAWGDIDADGDLDLVMSGNSATGLVTKIYRNDAGTFVDNGDTLTGVSRGESAFGDYDNDGDLDLVIVGQSAAGSVSEIYENDGGSFNRNMQADANLPAIRDGSVSFGDVDEDGDVDLLLTGESNLGAVSQIFLNQNCQLTIDPPGNTLEGDTGNTLFVFVVNRSGDIDKAVTADYAVSGSGTTNGGDFGGAFATGTVTIPGGSASQNLTINVSGDSAFEADEAFTVTLSNPSAEAELATPAASATILNDDGLIDISVASAENLEGDGGATPFTFTISRTGYTNKAVTVNYTVSGDVDGTDFTSSLTGNHLLGVGQASNTLSLLVTGDTTVELDEAFTVTLSNPTAGGEIGTASADGTILNDDGDLDIFALNAVQNEGDTGTTQFTFEVLRSGVVTSTATVDYQVAGSGVNPADAADFGGTFASDTITFTPGITTQIVTIDVTGDTVFEADENFSVTLNGATGGAVIGIASATGTIENDDTGLAITAVNGSDTEGAPLTFTVTRSGNIAGTTDVNYAVSGGDEYPADAADFGGTFPSGTASFAASETSQTITLTVSSDSTVEADETFTITLSAPTNNANLLTSAAAGTIENDDGSVSIGPDGLSQIEGNSGTVTYTYAVVLSSAAVAPVSVNYTVNGTVFDGANGADFGGSLPAGTLNFGIGEDSQQVMVAVSGDDMTEADESFTVNLSNMSGGFVIDTGVVTSTIENDDRSLSITALDGVKDEGHAGDTPFTFLVSRSGQPSGAISADYAVSLNNAAADDFSGGMVPSGTVSLADGQITTTLTILISGDTTVEPSESFDVELSNPDGATIQTGRATGIIQNDDNGYSIAAVTPSQPEGDSGNTIFAFTIKRNGTSTTNSAISYTVSGIGVNAADEADFGGFFDSGSAPFQAGQTDQEITISIAVSGDSAIEADENFVVTLSNPTGGEEISTATAIATIVNDDEGIRISALPGERSQAEGDSGTTPFNFTLDLVGTYTQVVTVDYTVSGAAGGANAADFDGGRFPAGTITFPVGVTSQALSIDVQGDTTAEPDEDFTITLSNATGGAGLGSAPAINGTIENDDGSSSATDLFLPSVFLRPELTPDLIVESITVVAGVPTVVIRNIGGAAVTEDFWVDLYINPPTPPTQVNQTIDTLQSDGMTWGIEGSPIAAGQSIVLTSSSQSLVTGGNRLIPAGATVYVQADSANLATNYGAVLEGHEINNGAYNNISSIINN